MGELVDGDDGREKRWWRLLDGGRGIGVKWKAEDAA